MYSIYHILLLDIGVFLVFNIYIDSKIESCVLYLYGVHVLQVGMWLF